MFSTTPLSPLVVTTKSTTASPAFRVLHGSGSAFVNTWRSGYFRFHLSKAPADAAHLYEFIGASFDPEVSLMVKACEVAGPETAVSKLAPHGLGIIEIPGADRRASHLVLASLPLRKLAAFIVHDANVQVVQGQASTA